MIHVLITASFDLNFISKIFPNGDLLYNDIQFYTTDERKEFDFVIMLNSVKHDMNIRVNQRNIIRINMEPPNAIAGYQQYGSKYEWLQLTQIKTNNSLLSHGCVPWQINMSYDDLKKMNLHTIKSKKLSWITSNLNVTRGHKIRMEFLKKLQENKIQFDLYGRGFKPISHKEEALIPYKYTIVFESMKFPYYWTEKLTDALLSGCLPIYVGSPDIYNYFPKDAIIAINPDDSKSVNCILDLLHRDPYSQHVDAINEARNLILDEYSLVPLIYRYIKYHNSTQGIYSGMFTEDIKITSGVDFWKRYPISKRLKLSLNRLLGK